MPVSDQGISNTRYMIIPRVLVFVTRGSQILLQLGSPGKKIWANLYNAIGGHVEAGEDILTAARRELFEETGLDLDATSQDKETMGGLRLCGIVFVDTACNPGVCLFLFTGECREGSPKNSQEGSIHWIECDDVASIPTVEDLPVLMKRVRSMKPGDTPFIAKSTYVDNKIVVTFVN